MKEYLQIGKGVPAPGWLLELSPEPEEGIGGERCG